MTAGAKNLDFGPAGERMRDAVEDIAKTVAGRGGRAFVVGGAVRDMMLGKTAKDVDIEVFGIGAEELQRAIGERYRFDPCGVSFGVLKLHGLDIDISLPRRESKRGIGHRGFMVDSDPSLTVAEAASRRDFTINAMYCDPLDGEIEDPYGGMGDLENGILRHVSAKFIEDPLRVLRGMQFVARFDLEPAPQTVEICRSMDIENLPCERIFEEWTKLLTKGVKISKGLEFLRATGWVRHFPELAALIGCRQDPKWHPEGDVWEHTKLCLDAFARRRTGDRNEDVIVGLAVTCHDFGKPATSAYDPVARRIRSLGHDEAGVKPALSFLKRMTNEERILREVPPLVKCHMQPYALWRAKAKDAAVRRLAVKVVRIDRLLRVCRADDEGRLPELLGGSSAGSDLKWLEDAAARLEIAAGAPKPILQGRHLIAMGFKPSARFGTWLKKCFDAQLDGAFGDLDGALAYFRREYGSETR